MSDKKLFLLDAYALIYRAYYAFIKNPRFNSKGLNTSAVFGFANTLEELLRTENPTHIAVAFDTAAPTFRHKMFPEYKAQRPPMPDDLRKAVPYIKQLLQAMNIAQMELEGWEADDIIGTFAKRAELAGFEVFMMTPDKDYCQLVSENIKIYKPRTREKGIDIWGPAEVCENFGIEHPLQVIDVLSLWGDASDNIPGAEGVGEKGSKELIGLYGSVQGLYDNLADIKGKKREKIERSYDNVMRAMKLIRIEIDVPLEFNEADLLYQSPDVEQLGALLDELEFRALKTRLLPQAAAELSTSAQPIQGSLFDSVPVEQLGSLAVEPEQTPQSNFATSTTVAHQYHLVDDDEAIETLITQLKSLRAFCFDTETTGTNVHEAELVGLSFAWQKHEAYYVPVPAERDEAQRLLERFRTVFETENITKVAQNLKFDLMMLEAYGIALHGPFFDTMIAHYLIEPDQAHDMDSLARNYLNYEPIAIETLIGEKGKKQGSMRDVPLDKITEYAAEDADITWQLAELFRLKLEDLKLDALFTKLEMPLIRVLADMELAGVRVDADFLKLFAGELTEEIIALEKRIIELAGMDFNVGSPKQLGEVLFDRLKLDPSAKKTAKSKQYSTNEKVLQKLVHKHPIVGAVLEYRQLKKLLSTYAEALPQLVNPKTDKVHTSYNQAVAATGRLSSNDPNLQNIPNRTARGRELRKAFIPSSSEHSFLAVDYSQIELRIIAHLSNDANMVEAFQNGYDIHAATAAKIYNVPQTEVSREMRTNAKGANFGIVYGISSFGLAENLGISRSEAKQLIDGYFATYPSVKEFMDKSIAIARNQAYVSTLLGRRRMLPDINSRNAIERGLAERNAINAPIQGTAADIIKLAMVRIHKAMKAEGLQSRMIMQVHDELVFDVLNTEMEQVRRLVEKHMTEAIELRVPLTVDAGVGSNWYEAH